MGLAFGCLKVGGVQEHGRKIRKIRMTVERVFKSSAYMNFILVTLALLIQLDCGKTCTNTCNNAQAQRNDTDRSRVSMEYFKSKSETCRFDLGKNSTTLSLVSHIGKKRRRYIGGFKLYYPNSLKTFRLMLPCGDVELNPGPNDARGERSRPCWKFPCGDCQPKTGKKKPERNTMCGLQLLVSRKVYKYVEHYI